MSASKNLGKVFMTPKGIWDKTLNYTKLDIVTNKVGKISCGYIATTDIEKNVEITDNRWLKLFELLDGDLTEEYKAVQTDVTNKATDVDTNKKAVDLIYSQMQKLYDVEISTTTPTNERTGLWINPDDISSVINIPEIKDDEVSDVDTWSSKKIDNVTGSLKEDISTKITKFYASSQGETHLADSDNGKIMDMMLYGKSEQKRYSGKNLLNATLQTTTQNGVTCTANGDGTYTINGTATSDTLFHIGYFIFEKDTKYKIVGCPQGGSLNTLYRLDGSLNANSDTGNGIVYSGDGNKRNARIVVFNGATVNNLLFKPMITTDLTATYDDFEPYTGGIPSPNPDYPQEIKSVVNPTVKVCGKNLLKISDETNSKNGETVNWDRGGILNVSGILSAETYYSNSGTQILSKGIYTFSVHGQFRKTESQDDKSYLFVRRKSDNYYISVIRIGNGESFKTFTLNEDTEVFIGFVDYETAKNHDEVYYIQIEKGSTATAYEPYTEQTVALPYTLNAIPVSSGGNVTIDGQQYIADYVDVERGKLVRMCKEYVITGSERLAMYWLGNASYLRNVCCINNFENIVLYDGINPLAMSDMFIGKISENADDERAIYLMLRGSGDKTLAIKFLDSDGITTVDLAKQWLIEHKPKTVFVLSTPEEIDLTSEEVQAFKALATYYPITNISINSKQLDGYTVLNYPISMENGWNYVKQQIGDTRDYIYDMDIQSAEAYVNSEYAVALTELEV
jgi:hypothetical protein